MKGLLVKCRGLLTRGGIMSDLLETNLDNVKVEYDLFGNKIEKLSMKERIGFLPISIWETDWTTVKRLKAIVGDTGQTRARDVRSGNFRKAGASYKETLGNSTNSMSIFNPHLAQMILSAYCPAHAKIYDPFGGGGTRGFIATAMGHNYWGVEIRQEEVDRIKEQQKILNKPFELICADSQYFPFQENFFDFSYTCPPYYNLEVYSDMPNDLSNAKTYEDFLTMMKNCLEWTYKGLKKDCLSVWVVGNFRDKKGELTHFNGDLIRLAKKVGFALHDELIFWGASKCASQRCGQFKANRKSVRVHEYIIVLKK